MKYQVIIKSFFPSREKSNTTQHQRRPSRWRVAAAFVTTVEYNGGEGTGQKGKRIRREVEVNGRFIFSGHRAGLSRMAGPSSADAASVAARFPGLGEPGWGAGSDGPKRGARP